jgi:hypothetical protein
MCRRLEGHVVHPNDSFFDSFAGRLCEPSGDTVRRLRHNPNTEETR